MERPFGLSFKYLNIFRVDNLDLCELLLENPDHPVCVCTMMHTEFVCAVGAAETITNKHTHTHSSSSMDSISIQEAVDQEECVP